MEKVSAHAARHPTRSAHSARVGSLIRRSLICLVALMAATGLAHAQQTPDSVSTRGQLLYTTHCIECHTTQMHWRTQRKAVDWETLKFQVSRWQGVANLGWSNTDIDDVARYLNDTIYKFPRQVSQAGQ